MCRLLVIFTSTLLILTIFESVGASPYSRDIEGNYKTEPDYETGVKVTQWTKEMNMNPEELGNYFEGDIMISNSTTRNGDSSGKRWPGGIVPVVISGSYTQKEMYNMNDAIKECNTKLKDCIQFVKRTNQPNYIEITSENSGCWSYICMQGGRQQLNLQSNGCAHNKGTPIHELLHAVGFWHEQTREERDSFVNINWNNIPQKNQHNFVKAKPGQTKSYGIPYDYGSVMHYSAYAFAINPKEKTIITKNPANAQIGQRNGFSNSDIAKVKKMYNCK